MKYHYFAIFGEELAIFRWPIGEISDSNVINALTNRVIQDEIPLEPLIAGNLLIMDEPGSGRKTSAELLVDAFAGEEGLLRQFGLYDYKAGRFKKVKRKWRKKKPSFH
ncbi:MAG: hypothetical protein LLG97_18730 [Deltaproteobacteria bacterium]|nr:hypothetical protein [Deltaproteobacteria bacterium]